MIIQCPKCETKFRVPQEKVAKGAVKVRCSKCAHVFVVRQDAQSLETIAASRPPAPSEPRPAPQDASVPPATTAVGGSPLPGSVPSLPAAGPDSEPPSVGGAGAPTLPAASEPELATDTLLSPPPFPPPPGASGMDAPGSAPPWAASPAGTDPVQALGLGQPPAASWASAAPPPLPSQRSFAQSVVSPTETPAADPDPTKDRFPPPPALTGDLAPGRDAFEPPAAPPPDAFSADPFADLPDLPEPDPPEALSLPEPAPVPPPFAVEPAEPARVAVGRIAPLTPYRSADLDAGPDWAESEDLRPLPPVSTLRWPPRLGFVLGIVLAFLLGVDWAPIGGFDGPVARSPAGLDDLRLTGFEVRPYTLAVEPSFWVATGWAETRARPHPEGVWVRVAAKDRADRERSVGEGLLDVAIPPTTLVKGPEAVDRFLDGLPPPEVPASARRPFQVVLPRVPGDDLRFEVGFRSANGAGGDESKEGR